MAAEQKTTPGPAAVYVSWATLKNVLEQFVEGVPNQIDRTVFPGLAWGVQNQLLPGLKFLGLIDEKSKPTASLHALANPSEETRKQLLEGILRDRYADLFSLDLSKATPAQVAEQMTKSYAVTGETREKAMRFFLAAADYVGVPLSSYLKPKTNGPGSSARKRRVLSRTRPAVAAEGDDEAAETPAAGTSRIVKLKSGGILTLSASIDFFALVPTDREFVFELIDKMAEYERANAAPEAS